MVFISVFYSFHFNSFLVFFIFSCLGGFPFIKRAIFFYSEGDVYRFISLSVARRSMLKIYFSSLFEVFELLVLNIDDRYCSIYGLL